jgi:glucose-6-phosphate-specific signal transduction histidine kinase
LKNFGADDIPKTIGAAGIFGKKSFSKFCGNLVFFFIMLGAAVAAVGHLQMENISAILTVLLHFSGNVVLGLIILGIGNFIATFAYDALSKSTKGGVYPFIVKYAILAFVLAMGLHTMGIAEDIVEMAFICIFGTVALTIILAFGLGGRDAAGKTMEHWLAKLRK